MKLRLLLLMLIVGVVELYAQSLYTPGAITKGKNAAYYCTAQGEVLLTVRNIKNVDTTYTMYYKNGEVVPEDTWLGGTLKFDQSDLAKALKDVLTTEEWNSIVGKRYSIGMTIVADSEGNTQEISFQFRTTDPVMTKLNPDRLLLLEEKFKKITKMAPSQADRNIRNIKYISSISYQDL